MRSKWYLLILLMFMVFIVSVGAISAADNGTASNVSSDIADSGSLNVSSNSGSSIIGGSSNGTSIESDVHVTTDNGSEIQNEITNGNNTVIYLDNQTFVLNSTSNYGLCVDSNKNLTICGGYSIGDGKTSTLSAENLANGMPTLLINSSSTVTLINVNFINFTGSHSYALVNNGTLVLINCTFDENYCSLLSYGDVVLINCTFIKNVEDKNIGEIEVYNNCTLFEMQNCTLINTTCSLTFNGESIVNNSNFRNSSINFENSINSTITNSVFDAGFDSAINIDTGGNFIVDNCTFSNFNSTSGFGVIYCSSYSDNISILNITNSKFNNNSAPWGGAIYAYINNGTVYLDNCSFDNNSASEYGGAIYTSGGGMVYLDNCSFDNNSASFYGGACYLNENATLKNCSFNNNSALAGGSIYCYKFYLNSTNCSYDGNSALYGGAIYGYNSTVLINGSIFKDNYALMAGGAVSSYLGSTVIDDSIFTDNSADVCGGAVVIGNSTETVISNSNFTSNDGQDYGNDVYSYGSNLTLNNNSISSVYNVSNDTLSVTSSDVSNGYVVYLDNNATGFCLEEKFDYPGSSFVDSRYYSGWYSIFNNTNLALNSLNYQKVGDYIKYIIVNYYGKVPNIVLNYAIWTFTDNNYTEPVTEDTINNIGYIIFWGKSHPGIPAISPILASTLLGDSYFSQLAANVSAIVNDTLSAYSSGVRIPDHYVEVDENGTGTLYDFGSIFSNYYQNFITFKTSNYTVVYDMNVTKITNTPVVYNGSDASFDIVVTNNGTMALYNVTVTEDSFDDLTFKSWTNVSGNWTYGLVDGKPTWTLNDSLGVNQSARITVVFSTENATVGDKVNTVIVSSNETGNISANNTTTMIENITNNTDSSTNETNETNEINETNDTGYSDNEEVIAKEDIKTTEPTGYPFIALIIALIGIIGTGFRKK